MRGADALQNSRLPQQTGDAGEGLEVIGSGFFRREQQKQDIDGLAVEGVEIDGFFKPRRRAEQMRQTGNLAMGNGDAIADGGRPKSFALQKRIEYDIAHEAGSRCGEGAQLFDRLFFACNPQVGQNGRRVQ